MWRFEKIVDVNKNLNGLCLLNKIIITLIQKIVSHITWNLKFPRLPPFMDNVLRSPGTGDIFPGPRCPTQVQAPSRGLCAAQELPMRAEQQRRAPGLQHRDYCENVSDQVIRPGHQTWNVPSESVNR